MVSVPKSVIDPVGSHRINYEATLSLLEGMRAAGIPRIVYASSAAVYPTDNANPHSETDYPDPSSPYGIDKLAGEFALNAYGRLYGIKATSLRFFNIYGERQDPTSAYSGVISIFADRIKSGRPLTIYGDGSQSRDFVYVRDLAALIARLTSDQEAPSRMNVGTGNSVTLNDLVGLMQTITDSTADVSYAEGRPGDIKISRADVTRLRAYHPVDFTPLEIGLKSLI
jgi:UDP-glucose 4-epimerase